MKLNLRLKLFLSYTLVTTLAFLLVELVLLTTMMVVFVRSSEMTPEEINAEVEKNWVPVISPYLANFHQNRTAIQLALQKFRGFVLLSRRIEVSDLIHLDFQSQNYLTLIFLDSRGRPIDSIPHPELEPDIDIPFEGNFRDELAEITSRIYTVTSSTDEPGTYFTPSIQRFYDEQLNEMIAEDDTEKVIEAVLSGATDFDDLHIENKNQVTGIVPIMYPNNENSMIGAIVWRAELVPWEIIQFRDFASKLLIIMAVTTVFSALIGTLFGIISSSNLVGRLSNLSTIINEWSHGNFSFKITDHEADELHQVAIDLNQMSGHIETLLLEKQEMSIIRERNRLARDLHDSVKQETFAASARLAAARSLIRSKPDSAEEHLTEANNILDRVRTELTSLIHELYPTILENRNLADSIRAFAHDWEDIYHIKTNIEIVGYQGLPKSVEKTFYLILQEALSNVARHSHASTVDIFLKQNSLNAFLMVSDNGCGMDTNLKSLGIGMKSMNERTKLMGGTMDMVSSPSEGTCIRIEIPLGGNHES